MSSAFFDTLSCGNGLLYAYEIMDFADLSASMTLSPGYGKFTFLSKKRAMYKFVYMKYNFLGLFYLSRDLKTEIVRTSQLAYFDPTTCVT